jgi:phosphoglycerol transferase MdoB-like AlkP superfamily enzyme
VKFQDINKAYYDSPARIFTPAIKLWLRVIGIALVMLFISRILYLLVYPSQFEALTAKDLFFAFLVGLRFDLSTALLTIALPTFPLWFPVGRKLEVPVRRFSAILTIVFLCVAAGFLWSDVLFFSESSRHFTVEPAGILKDVGPVIQMVFQDYPLPLLGLLAFLAILIPVVLRQFRPRTISNPSRPRWYAYPISFVLVVAVSVIGIRGGLQKEPLKSADAMRAEHVSAASLSLNGWYSFLETAVFHHRPPSALLPEAEAIARTRYLVGSAENTFNSDRYPLQRTVPSTASVAQPDEKLNVVLLIVESLNAAYLQSFGGRGDVMPFLDSLAGQSLIFTNCHAVGTRSFRGLCALLASVPNMLGNPYAMTISLPKLRGLGEIFAEQGYQVRFMHAAEEGSMGVLAVSQMAGYPSFVSASDFPRQDFNGSWGVWDHIALERMNREMQTMREPFHYGMFTLCTHSPWALPVGFAPHFTAAEPQAEVLNTYVYLDSALRDFFAHEAKTPHFKNTMYVIVGDHTARASEEERFRVACLFYSPGRIQPAVDAHVVSQLDLLPTILDLTGISTDQSSFGKSMIGRDSLRNVAIMTQSDLLYWRDGDKIFVSDTKRDLGLYDVHDPKQNLVPSDPQLTDSLRRGLYSFYQTSEEFLRNNRISPLKSEKVAVGH